MNTPHLDALMYKAKRRPDSYYPDSYCRDIAEELLFTHGPALVEALKALVDRHECYHNIELFDCKTCNGKELLAQLEQEAQP